MAFWFTGDEEHQDPRFSKWGSLELYVKAGTRCMSQVHGRHGLPAEWFVPNDWVRGWGATRHASWLVRQQVWERVPGGYRFEWIRVQNTPDYVRKARKAEADKKARQRAMSRGGHR